MRTQFFFFEIIEHSSNNSISETTNFCRMLEPLISDKDWIEQLIVLSLKFLRPANFNKRYFDWDHFDIGYILWHVRMWILTRVKAERCLMLLAAINVGERNLSTIAFRKRVIMKYAW